MEHQVICLVLILDRKGLEVLQRLQALSQQSDQHTGGCDETAEPSRN